MGSRSRGGARTFPLQGAEQGLLLLVGVAADELIQQDALAFRELPEFDTAAPLLEGASSGGLYFKIVDDFPRNAFDVHQGMMDPEDIQPLWQAHRPAPGEVLESQSVWADVQELPDDEHVIGSRWEEEGKGAILGFVSFDFPEV